jgi:hypothetical protein
MMVGMFLSRKMSKEEIALYKFIRTRVFFIRGTKVILSTHLVGLYGIEPRVLIQAFKRNKAHFPDWCVFQLNAAEFSALKSHFVISEYNHIRRSLPYALTEQGVVILSGILRSERAIAMNIAIMRAFVRLPSRPYLKARLSG